MRIYRLESVSFGWTVAPLGWERDDFSHPIESRFEGKSKMDVWTPVEIITLREGTNIDFPDYLVGKPVLSEKAKSVFEKYLNSEVEYLPLTYGDKNLFLLNVLNVIDCRDKEKIMSPSASKQVFDLTRIPEDTLIFKTPEYIRTHIYITDQFVKLVKEHQLKGFQFTEAWDSEFTEEMEQAKQRKYQEKLDSIEKHKGPEFSYEEAIKKADNGLAIASGKWKMQRDVEGRLWLGQIGDDAEYHWLMPVYIPPVLLGYLWHEVDRSEL